MLKIIDLNKKVGNRQILKSININVEKGMIYGFIGHNGAGKTTTMRSIVGLTTFEQGEIVIDGKSYSKKVDIQQTIGYLPESPSFYGYMTAPEYLSYLDRSSSRKDIRNLIEKVGLANARKKKVATYSRGMKQRLGMAAAMIHRPKLMIMDEPTSALDPAGRYELFDMIETLRDEGSTIILSTHILEDIERVSDRIGIIKEGAMLREDNVDNVLSDYYHPIFDVTLMEPGDHDFTYFDQFQWIDLVRAEGDKVSITVNDVDYGKKNMLNTLTDSKLPVVGFELRKPNLEEVFMKEIRL